MSDIERMNRRNEDVRRLAAEAQRFKEQYTARQANTERAMAEAIDGIRPDGSPVEHVADTPGGAAALLVLVVAIAVIYVVFSALVAIAVVGGGILVGALVLGLIGVPGLKLIEVLVPSGARSGLMRAYVTMVLAFLAFGLAAALVHGLLFVLLDLWGDRLLPAVPALGSISAVVRASWYFFTNSVAPEALVAALTPAGIGVTLAILAVVAFVGGALMLGWRDPARFGGLGGFARGLPVIALPLVVGVGGVTALAAWLAASGY